MKVSHTCLLVSDFERSLTFYAWLGFEQRRWLGNEVRRSVFCGLPGEEEQLQLGLAEAPSAAAAGFGHLALEVDDLSATLSNLASHGVTPDRPPAQAGSVRLCFVHDPDGYAIELIEQVQ